MADETAPVLQPLPETVTSAPSASLSTDEVAVQVHLNTDAVPAQVKGPDHGAPETLVVHELHVHADHVITDTSSPLAVQIPDEIRSDALTPIARAWANGPRTVEDVFRDAAAKKS